MNTLEEWVQLVTAELGLAGETDRKLVLDLARDVAHGVARPAAPLTTYLVGLAAGAAGGGPEAVRAAAERVSELVGRWPGSMEVPSDRPSRERRTSILPQLSVRRGRAAVKFYQAAFEAVEVHRVGGAEEGADLVAQLRVGDASFWVSDESSPHRNFSPESLGGATARMLLIVEDPDAVVARALSAGATQVSPVTEEHDWRLGRIEDPFGHHWEIGKPLAPWPPAGIGTQSR